MPVNVMRNPAVSVSVKDARGTSSWLFGVGALSACLCFFWAIPSLQRWTGWEPVLCWFVCGALLMFGPLLAAGALVLHREGRAGGPGSAWPLRRLWRERLRFRRLTWRDGVWTLAALLAIGVLTAGLQAWMLRWHAGPLYPEALQVAPLSSGRYWILAAWLPFWVLNIMAEEVVWRGVILPQQERRFGRWAWLVHAAGWGLFHVAFGLPMLLVLLPILLIQSWLVQHTRNSWTGVIVHAGLNGPGFLAIALGWL